MEPELLVIEDLGVSEAMMLEPVAIVLEPEAIWWFCNFSDILSLKIRFKGFIIYYFLCG